jgi:integrase/recombinase XerD
MGGCFMNQIYGSEQLLSEITIMLHENIPNLDIEKMKSNLSSIMTNYHTVPIQKDEPHPDIKDKMELFLASKKLEGLSPNTLRNYRLDLIILANKVKKKVKDITSADIRVHLAEFNHLKMSSMGRKLTSMKSFFGWLTSEEIIQRDPTSKLKSPKIEKRMPKSLTIEELELLRETCKTLRERSLLECMYSSGTRLSEIQNLNKSDINFQTMSCKVIGKGNKEREVYFSFKAIYHLQKYLESRKDNNEALFVSERQPYERLSCRGIQREISTIAERSKIGKAVSPHDIRRSFATLTLNNGAQIVAVQELLGHSSPDTTMRYARITEERKREQHRKFLVQ